MSDSKDIIRFGKWILSEFKKYRYGNEGSGDILESIWSSGLSKLKSGYSVSKLLSEASIQEQMDALQKYKSIVENKPF
jgi:hypothetical protein